MLILEKHCYKCRQMLPVTMFHKDKTRKDGLSPRCRDCEKRRNIKRAKRKSEQDFLLSSQSKQAFNAIAQHSIYFIAHPHTPEHVKIGYTSSLARRIKSFLCATSGNILLLSLLPVPSKDAELTYHRQFEPFRIGTTEWFLAKPPLLQLISSLDQTTARQAVATLTQGQQNRIIIPPIDNWIDSLPFL